VVEDSGYGDKTRKLYDNLKQALTNRYGQGEENEFLRNGAIWTGGHEWMWSLSDRERVHSTSWLTVNDALYRKNLQGIKLDATGVNPGSSLVTVVYEFRNFEKCRIEAKARRDSNL
jgi:hypothetical protein